MKKIILILACLFPLTGIAQSGYSISGKISGFNRPSKIYLGYETATSEFKYRDSVDIINGEFHFKGSLSEPVEAILSVPRKVSTTTPDRLRFFLENSKISVSAADSIKHGLVSGSSSDIEDKALSAAIKSKVDSMAKLDSEFRGKPKDAAFKKAAETFASLSADVKDIREEFVESHLNSFIGLYTFNTYILDEKSDLKKAELLFRSFSSQLQSSDLGKQVLEQIEIGKKTQMGIKAIDFTQNDINGKPFTLSSLKGKYVLVDFWASWCGPCRVENPNLVEVYHQLKGKDFEIVGVSLDQSKIAWAAAIKKDKLAWTQVCDLKAWKNEVAVQYGITSLPQNLLLNPQGIIIARNLRGEDLKARLSELIK